MYPSLAALLRGEQEWQQNQQLERLLFRRHLGRFHPETAQLLKLDSRSLIPPLRRRPSLIDLISPATPSLPWGGSQHARLTE